MGIKFALTPNFGEGQEQVIYWFIAVSQRLFFRLFHRQSKR